MTDISVVILVGKEELHIRRCLEKLAALSPRQVFVVESQKGDRTHEIAEATARELGWQVDRNSTVDLLSRPTFFSAVWHDWPGNQAAQFNWAVDALGESEKCEVRSEKCGGWILRLDADEYLMPDTIEKLKKYLSQPPTSTSSPAGLTLELKRRFCGGEIRHATNGIRQVRLFRFGKARYAEGLMDERLIVDGEVADFDGAFYDDSLMPMSEWREKHRGYAKREARQAIESMRTGVWTDPRKASYYKLPRYFRALAYFGVRYFLKRGFLDGYAGWMWNFWQGLWYRWIVDREIGLTQRNGGTERRGGRE